MYKAQDGGARSASYLLLKHLVKVQGKIVSAVFGDMLNINVSLLI